MRPASFHPGNVLGRPVRSEFFTRRKRRRATFIRIHSSAAIFYSQRSRYVSSTRSNVHKHSRRAGKLACLFALAKRKKEWENTEFSVRARRYGTCVRLASSFVVFCAVIAHHHHHQRRTSTTAIASCHSRAKRDHAAAISLQSHPRRSRVVIRCCVRYTRPARISCFIYSR